LKRTNGRPYIKKGETDVVLGRVERGGRLRLIQIKDAKADITGPVLEKHVSQDALLQTDAHSDVRDNRSAREVCGTPHDQSSQELRDWREPYAIGGERVFLAQARHLRQLSQGSIKHLQRYCNEFSYRFNRRQQQPEMFGMTVKNLVRGKVLSYKGLTSSASEL
jgi:transposase-like protein